VITSRVIVPIEEASFGSGCYLEENELDLETEW
jgi:hypothetical protein